LLQRRQGITGARDGPPDDQIGCAGLDGALGCHDPALVIGIIVS